MIYLFSDTVTIPNLYNIDSSTYHIEFKNNVTNEIFTLDASNLSCNKLYYSFNIDSSCLSQNEYTMNVYDDASTFLGSFLAQKGIGEAEHTSFENDTEYKEFEP